MPRDQSRIYADTYSEEHFNPRRDEVISNLELISQRLGINLDADSIVEIGAGSGAETAALRSRYPSARILAFDNDARVMSGEAAHYANETFCADLQQILVEARVNPNIFGNVELVIALRTSALASRDLVKGLKSMNFPGRVITSFIDESETDVESRRAAEELQRMAFRKELSVVALSERRGHNERAYIMNSDLAEGLRS